MATRSIASLSLTFGLVSIPVRLYSATESSSAIRFKLMAPGGARVRQTYITDVLPTPAAAPEPEVEDEPVRPAKGRAAAAKRVIDFPSARVEPPAPAPSAPAIGLEAPVSRGDMVKGYEFEKGQFVLFTDEELKALAEESRQTIDIVSFIPERSVDPLYYDKPYFLVPDKRGAKPYSLLLQAMKATGRCALAKWAWRSKEYVVQVRPSEGGLVLQQLLYADEVRSIADLHVDLVPVSEAELTLAKQIIEQISADSYDPTQFVDEEKQRILAAVERKVAGKQIITHEHHAAAPGSGQVLDLMEALRASLGASPRKSASSTTATDRKPPQRAVSSSVSAKTNKKSARR